MELPVGKTCKVCDEHKPLDDFYNHPEGVFGKLHRCKECHKAAVRKNRAENLEYYRAYDRARAWLPERVLLRKKREERVKNDPELRAIDAARVKAWMGRHAIKRHAHNAVSNAIRDGKLAPQPCERCGDAIGVQAHQEDGGVLVCKIVTPVVAGAGAAGVSPAQSIWVLRKSTVRLRDWSPQAEG